MQTVTFAREYRHRLDGLREARYPAGEMEVSNEVAEAARKAGALKEETSGKRSAKGSGTGGDNQPQS